MSADDLVHRLKSNVDLFLRRRELSFLEEVFCKHAIDFTTVTFKEEQIILTGGVQSALCELGVRVKQQVDEIRPKLDTAASLVLAFNSGRNFGLYFDEFIQVLKQPPPNLNLIVPDLDVARLKEIFDKYAKDTSAFFQVEKEFSDNEESDAIDVEQVEGIDTSSEFGEQDSPKLCEDTAQPESTSSDPDDTSSNRNMDSLVVFPAELQSALSDLGMQIDLVEAAVIVSSMDLDENGGMDFEEFRRAVERPPTQLEQWAATLQLPGMLAACLSDDADNESGVKSLRQLSTLSEERLDAAATAFSESLHQLLVKAQAQLRDMFAMVDAKAAEDGGSASKFTTFKMSTGGVADYFQGLAGRIGLPGPTHTRAHSLGTVHTFEIRYESSLQSARTNPIAKD
jgi:hypothetical protein